MSFLEERGIGRDVQVTVVPNVCAAVLFDLKCGDLKIRPDRAMGYAACVNAFRGDPFRSGNFGAGTGATVGKTRGLPWAMKGGIGAAAFRYGELEAGAIAAVNCVGDVIQGGKIIAGTRTEDEKHFAGSEEIILRNYKDPRDFFSIPLADGNTVLGCLITNLKCDKAGATRLAAQGQNGIARAIRPAHTLYDGDTVFALCAGAVKASLDAAGILCAMAMEAAIIDGVKNACSLAGFPGARDFFL
jgi:L-aminopeptidase/D-esterase-like protein